MSHPLEDVIQKSDGFVLIGQSAADRFPGYSYNQYTKAGKRFYCLDLDGIAASRGPTKGGKVYHSVAELPADRSDLAVIWVHPHTAKRAVDVAHDAGCKRVWFSFKTGHPDAVARARELGMEVVEIGRCPVMYFDGKSGACKAHAFAAKVSGLYGKPPQTDPTAKRRELM
ncbi:MAG: CoA-binding protein [Myxococcota bacterium]